MQTRLAFLLLVGAASVAAAQVGRSPDYHPGPRWLIGGERGWDYLAIDTIRRRLYVTHATQVHVLDVESGRPIGLIANTPGVHGVTFAYDLRKGFISNGRDTSVTVFDLESLDTLARIKVTGANPDAITYDQASGRVFTFNARSASATAIDAKTHAVAGTITLGGKPEFAVTDGKRMYVNIEDKSEIVVFDPRTLEIAAHWPLRPCEEPTGMAIDRAHRRLFVGCGNKLMAVVDADRGTVVTTLPIGGGVDGTAFDPGTQLAFSSNGDGNITVVHEDSPTSFRVVATVATQQYARTMTVDLKTHRLFTAAAEILPAAAPTAAEPNPRPTVKPGTFTVLVIEP